MDVTLPSPGEDPEAEAEVVQVLVSPGARMQAGDPVAVVAFEKADVEVAAPAAGVVVAVLVEPGDLLRPGDVLISMTEA